MSNKNPEKALNAILDNESEIDGQVVYPITIARYALLELVESPFITADGKFDVMNIIPTVFIMCNGITTLSKYNSKNVDELKAKSLEWCEENKIQSLDKFITAIISRLKGTNDAAPTGTSDNDGKKK